MGFMTKVVILIIMVVCLVSVAHAISGQATLLNQTYPPSNCLSSRDKRVMIAKVHSGLYANGSGCGRRYRVKCIGGTNKAIRDACTGNTVDVTVIGPCDAFCSVNQLELSEEAFAKIGRVALGRINIEYEQI